MSQLTASKDHVPAEPKLAIVISCYNYGSYVDRAIRSVLDQNRPDCELVVVDDGSTDNSWDIISGFDVAAFKLQNGGARRACLYGFDKTRAPFVLFLDADDELKPGSLATIVGRLDENVAKLQFPLTRIDRDGHIIGSAQPPLSDFRERSALARRVLKSGVYVSSPTSGNVFRRDLCDLLREAEYDSFVDGVILFAAPFYGDVVSLSDELGRYRIHGQNDSGLGRAPDANSIERDINRFLARMSHLREVIARRAPDQQLANPEKTFYCRERRFCLDVASGRRPRMTASLSLVATLIGEPLSFKNKFAMSLFYLMASVLPNGKRRALLAYRHQVGQRSAAGFAKAIFQ